MVSSHRFGSRFRFCAAFPVVVLAASLAAPVTAQTPLAEKLAAVAKAVDEKRTALHIPGAALVIVQNDQIIYMEGMGYRNVAKKQPVTPDTLFAIGSSTKSFTAFAVLLGEADGKLSLDNSPRKFLPYFALQDKNAQDKITLRDLMCHNSGLPRTDLLWYTNALTRQEVISALAYVTPTAKLGEKFQYQNVCFAAAGEAVARAENTSYEGFVQARIFDPLGMTHTTFSASAMQKSPDFATGYDGQSATKFPHPLPLHPLQNIAPAGAINSSARDMAQWLRVLTGGGTIDGKTLLPPSEFAKLSENQMKVGGTIHYGLGWFVRDWSGHKVVEHGGNIDGFNAEVAFMPDQKLGFVLLTNVSASSLGASSLEIVWDNLVGKTGKADGTASSPGSEAVPAPEEAGTYATPGLTAEVTVKKDKLTLAVPEQPPYPLTPLSGRRYKLDAPAPDGFFITFRPKKNKPTETEAFLEQPQGSLVLSRLAPPAEAGTAQNELVGAYAAEKTDGPLSSVEVTLRSGRPTLIVPNQPPYPLIVAGKDTYSSPSLPDTYSVLLRRNTKGAVSGLVLKQPEGEFVFVRKAREKPFVSPLSPAALFAKMQTAYGGVNVLKSHTTRRVESSAVIASQGLTVRQTEWKRGPDLSAQKTVLFALKPPKAIGTTWDIFDGKTQMSSSSFAPSSSAASGTAWENAKNEARFSPLLYPSLVYKTVEIIGKETVPVRTAKGETVYVVKKTPFKGNVITDYVSTKTFRVLRRDHISTKGEGDTAQSIPASETFSDFRVVSGELVPFRIVTVSPGLGTVVQTVQSVVFNQPLKKSVFEAPPKK